MAGVAVRVGTPEEFREALSKRVAHIIITEHMDMSVLTTSAVDEETQLTVYESLVGKRLTSATQSIQVLTLRCVGSVSCLYATGCAQCDRHCAACTDVVCAVNTEGSKACLFSVTCSCVTCVLWLHSHIICIMRDRGA